MTDWDWERFKAFVRTPGFEVSDAGPLKSPISSFNITRNDKNELILESVVMGEALPGSSPTRQPGEVWSSAEVVGFQGHSGMTCKARGVLTFHDHQTHNSHGIKETTQKSKVNHLEASIRSDLTPAFTIDWLANIDEGLYVWQGSSIKDQHETADSRTLGYGDGEVRLSSSRVPRQSSSSTVLEMVIDGHRLFLSRSHADAAKGIKDPGYIFYVGTPDDETRKRLREVICFCLGNYQVYLGSTWLSERSEMVSLSAVSPPSIGRITEIPAMPPAPIGCGNTNVVDCKLVSRIANAIYARYDELRFGWFSWAYWHAVCAPVHIAAAHFGAAIEGLQSAYVKAHPTKFERNIVDSARWNPLKAAILKAIGESALDPDAARILDNKVQSNLNQVPAATLSERVLSELGLVLGEAESDAWRRRNMAAHGTELDIEAVIPTIRQTKLLRILIHRLVLRISSASDNYYDHYTLGHPIRKVTEPVS